MNRKKLNNIIKVTIMTIAMSGISLFAGSFDASASQNLEREFTEIIDKYKNEKVVVEDGISLRRGESLNLSQYKGWELSNENTLEIDESGIAKVKDSGTVFLSNKIGDSVYVVEVYVPSVVKENYNLKNTVVDRNYYKVFLDPGHGGADNGAAGNGLLEDELTLQISLKLRDKLKEKGIEVKMSRESDVYVGLGERAEIANAYGADLFLSPHINSFTSSSAKGIETYYHTDKSTHRPLSSNIQENAIKETGAANRGVKTANFAVLRESSMPSALFESGFISNPEEAAKLRTSEYQNKLATALADGVERYLKDNIKLNGSEVQPPEEPTPPTTNPSETKTGTITASS
ncbi:N-acetylmuramoyl-L-alanine amidase, partial [uncultured Clostridium sp.]|uniref:N-acetylmuramoyl-L-alanine amidase family protein n=1 Tax=uncultured Clostridium sp. TaxID=59620 RepID=UPI0026361B82